MNRGNRLEKQKFTTDEKSEIYGRLSSMQLKYHKGVIHQTLDSTSLKVTAQQLIWQFDTWRQFEGNVPVEKVSGVMPSNWILSPQVLYYLGDKIQNVIH